MCFGVFEMMFILDMNSIYNEPINGKDLIDKQLEYQNKHLDSR